MILTKEVYTPQGYEGAPRPSSLYEEHQKLTSKSLVPFAGWWMPILYTSILEEHAAVRTTAGLFDVTHMGTMEISGPGATEFLNVVSTNDLKRIQPGQVQYNYLLDIDGRVLDDLLIYKRAEERYMLVVNACNAEKDLDWLRAVLSRRIVIDREHTEREVEARPTLKYLREDEGEALVGIALQGPASQAILQELLTPPQKQMLGELKRFRFLSMTIAGLPVLLARSGYTGENLGYECFLHPRHAPQWWNLLLDKGKAHQIRPTGLGSRDSTRIEAGFPLYGHELAGKFDLSPMEAGYGAFVRTEKSFFIGKAACLERQARIKSEIVRFQMNNRRIRTVRQGDIVANSKGQYLGRVTSASYVGEDQVGLAYIDRRHLKEGTKLAIFLLPTKLPPLKSLDQLELGDTLLLPEPATILPRFRRV